MMVLLRLFYEFFKTGLFSVGGGMATIPFLQHMGETTGWFTNGDLTTMIAVSESTPGPMGVNMATYVGFEIAGIPGAVIATLGLITPSIIVILIIAGFLQKFRHSKGVEATFSGLRPASTALIASAGLSVAWSVFTVTNQLAPDSFPADSLAHGAAGSGGVRVYEVDPAEKAAPHLVHCRRCGGGDYFPVLSNERNRNMPIKNRPRHSVPGPVCIIREDAG